MSGSLRNKLSQFEIPPPPGIWIAVSAELDSSSFPHDAILSARLEEAYVAPPPSAWPAIQLSLREKTIIQKPAKVVPLLYRRLAIAVMLAAVVAVSIMYFFTGNETRSLSPVAVMQKSSTGIRTDESVALAAPSPARIITSKPTAVVMRTLQSAPRFYAQQAAYMPEEEPEPADISGASFADLRTVNTEPHVSVPARPLRDAGGNIIMDMKLIGQPNDPYITVTGPNGSQTRISNKFLNCLNYLYGDMSNDDANYDGLFWKDKFQSWRDKLLNENSFIPAANNFFDIFEMKEMIQE